MAKPHQNRMDEAVDKTKHQDTVDSTHKMSDTTRSDAIHDTYSKQGHDTLKDTATAAGDNNTAQHWGKNAAGETYLNVSDPKHLYEGSAATIAGEHSHIAHHNLESAKHEIHAAMTDAGNDPEAYDHSLRALNEAEKNTSAALDATAYKLKDNAPESPMASLLPGADKTDKTDDSKEAPLEGVLASYSDKPTSTDENETDSQHHNAAENNNLPTSDANRDHQLTHLDYLNAMANQRNAHSEAENRSLQPNEEEDNRAIG